MAFVSNEFLYVINTEDAELLFGGNIDETSIVPKVIFTEDGNYIIITEQNLYVVNVAGQALAASYTAEFSDPYNNVVCIPGLDRIYAFKNDGSSYIFSTEGIASVSRTDDPGSGLVYENDLSVNNFGNTALSGRHQLSDAFKLSVSGANLDPDLYYSPDGRYAIMSYADGVLEIFKDSDKGSVTYTVNEFQDRVSALSINGDMLVAGNSSGRILLYDMASGSVIRIWNSGLACIDVMFDKSGKYFIYLTGNRDTINVYSVDHEEALFSMYSPEGFTGIAFSDDGSCAVGVADSVYVKGELLTDEEELISRAKALAGR